MNLALAEGLILYKFDDFCSLVYCNLIFLFYWKYSKAFAYFIELWRVLGYQSALMFFF